MHISNVNISFKNNITHILHYVKTITCQKRLRIPKRRGGCMQILCLGYAKQLVIIGSLTFLMTPPPR